MTEARVVNIVPDAYEARVFLQQARGFVDDAAAAD